MRNESTVIGQLLVRRTPPFDPFPLELLSAKTVRRLIGVGDRSDMAYGFSDSSTSRACIPRISFDPRRIGVSNLPTYRANLPAARATITGLVINQRAMWQI
jgi:hypothetical protein